MIHTEIFENNNKQYQRTWSDDFTLIQHPSGIEYFEAVDVLPTKWTYTESENEKPKEPEEAQQ